MDESLRERYTDNLGRLSSFVLRMCAVCAHWSRLDEVILVSTHGVRL